MKMDRPHLVISLLVFAALLSNCFCIRCYDCFHDPSQGMSSDCDQISQGGSEYISECYENNYCSKYWEQNTYTGNVLVDRTCGFSRYISNDTFGCHFRGQKFWRIRECVCKGDLCNGSTRGQPSSPVFPVKYLAMSLLGLALY